MLAAAALTANPLDPSTLLPALGPWVLAGIAVIVFIESGVLFPFLPGDSLLVTAAILAPQLGVSPWAVAGVATLAAIAGDQVGYMIGRRFGRRLFTPEARVLRTSRLVEAERFFARYGPPALVLGRFVPVVRTYVPLAAGTAALHYPRFLTWNVLGGVAWAAGLTLAGVLLGGIPLVADHIDVLMIVIVLVSVVPIAIGALRRWRRARLTV
ncbi:DedA family protein [Promicromonospora sukumoe]|uniref:DedA family protein n=1 Tax=Promicromonospora sukumoe TaxID=88382 RepID=UPI0037CBB70B